MSFSIKDKRKIQLLRKTIVVLTQSSVDLGIHFTKTEVSNDFTIFKFNLILFRFVSLPNKMMEPILWQILEATGSVNLFHLIFWLRMKELNDSR